MKKRFKKIYLEITNACNLSCSFCIKNRRSVKYLEIDKFSEILEKIEKYTDYLYFHVLGEPLMHPMIIQFIDLASKRFKVQITTNGYLIDKIIEQKNIRQLNISLHSFDIKYKVSLDDYMKNIFCAIDKLIQNDTYVVLRLWVNNTYQEEMLKMIESYYNCKIVLDSNGFKINKNLYIQPFHEFIWPDLDNDYYCDKGSCYGLRDHIGILVDGTIIPCCLDSKGIINLGNIYDNDLDDILLSDRVKDMILGFQNHHKKEELCKHCSFLEDR